MEYDMENRDHKTLFTMRYSDLALMPDIEPSIPKTLDELRKRNNLLQFALPYDTDEIPEL